MAAPLGIAVLHLVIGQHGSQGRAPVHGAFSLIGNAVAHQDLGFFLLAEGPPLIGRKSGTFAAGSLDGAAASFFKSGHQLLDGTGFPGLAVVPRAEHLQEGPLGPLVIVRIAGAEFTVPVEGEANPVQLLPVTGHILVGGLFRMLAGLDGILLCRKAEGVVSHRMKDVEALQALVAGIDVAGDVSQRMSYMQARTAGVREHVQHIVFGFVRIFNRHGRSCSGPTTAAIFSQSQ